MLDEDEENILIYFSFFNAIVAMIVGKSLGELALLSQRCWGLYGSSW